MTTVLFDYESGNLHSAEKAFQRMAREGGAGVLVSSHDIALLDRFAMRRLALVATPSGANRVTSRLVEVAEAAA